MVEERERDEGSCSSEEEMVVRNFKEKDLMRSRLSSRLCSTRLGFTSKEMDLSDETAYISCMIGFNVDVRYPFPTNVAKSLIILIYTLCPLNNNSSLSVYFPLFHR